MLRVRANMTEPSFRMHPNAKLAILSVTTVSQFTDDLFLTDKPSQIRTGGSIVHAESIPHFLISEHMCFYQLDT